MSDEVTLIDEAGVERRFRVHDAFDLDGASYYLVEDAADAETVLLLREGEGGLQTVDGEEFERVMGSLANDEVE